MLWIPSTSPAISSSRFAGAGFATSTQISIRVPLSGSERIWNSSSNQTRPLLHAKHADSLLAQRVFDIEPRSIIGNRQVKVSIALFQGDVCFGGSAVLLDIAQAFLNQAKQAQGSLCGNGTRHVLVGEQNFDSLLRGEFLAERSTPGTKPSRSRVEECRRWERV